MPKQVANITNFSGGLNNKTNPRDIADNQFQDLDTISVETPGKIKMMGAKKIVSIKSNNGITSGTVNHGNGLAYLKTDRDLGNVALENTESLFINDVNTKTIKIFDYTDNAYETSKAISLAKTTTSPTTATASYVDYLLTDGNVVISPHTPFHSNNIPKWFGYIKRDYNLGLTTSGSALDNIKHSYSGYYIDDMFISPIKGSDAVSNDPTWDYAFDSPKTSSRYLVSLESEILLNPSTPSITFPTSDGDNGRIAEEYEDIRAALDAHKDYTSSSHFGSMYMYAWFNHATTTSDLGGGNIKVFKSVANTDGTYETYDLFASNIYDTEEAYPVHIGQIAQPTLSADYVRQLYISFIGRLPNRPRQTGIKIYFCKTITGVSNAVKDIRFGQRYLLCELDFEKGIRFGGTTDWNPFGYPTFNNTTAINKDSSANTEFNYVFPLSYVASGQNYLYGARILTFQDNYTEPWIEKNPNIIGKPGTGWKTSTIINRKSYIGNVSYSNETNSGLVESQDTVFKSRVNEFGYFEYDRRLEVEINDGDNIIKLASLNGRLFEFKTKKLYIINLTRDIEYLEADLDYKGANKDYHVVSGDSFIAWFNQYGVFLYDGEQIRDLLIDETGQERIADWSTTYYHDDAIISYEPHDKTIIIANKTNQMVLNFDLKSLSWTKGSKRCLTNSVTNPVINADGDILEYAQIATQNVDTGETLQFDITSSTSKIAIESTSNPWATGTILLIDNEKMTVTNTANASGSGYYWVDVDRGTNSTSAASHLSGAVIKRVQTAGLELHKWEKSPSKLLDSWQIDEMALKTKDFTLGDPSVDKKIISVYLNYKNGRGVSLYGFSGSTEEKLADLDGFDETDYKVLKISIRNAKEQFDDVDAFKSIKSFGLRFDAENVLPNFEVNDMQIVFRPKALK